MRGESKGDGGSKRTRRVGLEFVGENDLFGENLAGAYSQTRSRDYPYNSLPADATLTCFTPADMPPKS